MDLYILDDQLRRTEFVEGYESLVWTERFREFGDFELEIDPRYADSVLKTEGTMLAISGSKRVMVVDTYENTTTEDGKRVLKITGLSLEAVLQQRANQRAFYSGGNAEVLEIEDTPGNIMRYMFDYICRDNTDIPTDEIPFLEAGEISPPSTIEEPSDDVIMRLDLGTLYDTLKSIGDIYDLGFRIIRVADDSKLYFEVYSGFDRTTRQTENPAVVFSTELDSLTDTTELHSAAALKNCAYVFGGGSSVIVWRNEEVVEGFEKRVLIVNADDIVGDLTGAPLIAALEQRGREELAKNGMVIVFDGEIPQYSEYVYDRDYFLGDLVEQRGDNGITTLMRVTEHIYAIDSQGEKSYPALSVASIILPGSWNAQPKTKVWDDFTTENWDDL